MQLTGTHDGFHHQTKWNITSLIYQNTNFEDVREFQFRFQVGRQDCGPHAWPLPSHFHSCPLGTTIHQDPGRGHLPPAHKCMEQAIKLTLWQLFSHPFDGPVSAHLLLGEEIKKSSSDVQKIMTGGYLNRAELMPGYEVKSRSISARVDDKKGPTSLLVDLHLGTIKCIKSLIGDYCGDY